MAKLHYCANGRCVTEQVLAYQVTRDNEDYKPIKEYYDDYKECWYQQIEEYIARDEFDAEFNYKVLRAVETFDGGRAESLAKKNKWSSLGMFNRWLYRVLFNWKSNIKTSSYRYKKRPSVQCPVCGRMVTKIDEEHLNHYKTLSDLPSFVVWKGDIYEVCTSVKPYIYTWGEKTIAKWKLLNGEPKECSQLKKRIRWRWYDSSDKKGVLCPFTRRIVDEISNEYLRTLSDKFNRYAQKMSWFEFAEKHPEQLIEAEVYSLDYMESDALDQEGFLKDHLSSVRRTEDSVPLMDHEMIKSHEVHLDYEYAFHAIEECIKDSQDQEILKMITSGYRVEDIPDVLGIDKKDVRKRIKAIRDSAKDLESLLKE